MTTHIFRIFLHELTLFYDSPDIGGRQLAIRARHLAHGMRQKQYPDLRFGAHQL
ncbi:MAG TPA: hypothetical protein VMH83_06305 [Candidatus Acidoferrum sp.]|nr:hypothetical protein [Candidatus Acidoferrum sp.]